MARDKEENLDEWINEKLNFSLIPCFSFFSNHSALLFLFFVQAQEIIIKKKKSMGIYSEECRNYSCPNEIVEPEQQMLIGKEKRLMRLFKTSNW